MSSGTWLTQRRAFLIIALTLLLVTTARFNGDLPAFFWSLIVLAGTVYLDDDKAGGRR